jgi:hypothetical protein
MKKFMGWLGGIAAAVIASLVVYYVTRPPVEMQFEGMVIDRVQNAPLPKVMVLFDVSKSSVDGTYHGETDENGSYNVKVPGVSKSSRVVLHVDAKGYLDDPHLYTSLDIDNRYDPDLTPVSGPVAAPRPPPSAVRPVYIRKLAVEAIRILPQKK